MFVAATFCGIYLYTMELAPTSHRGKMLGYSSFAARIGSFCGPQASLLFSWNKPGTLILFAVLAASAGLLCYRLPDTKDVPTPSTAAEVQRRKDEKDGRVQATVVENKYAAELP
ncbi:solute carrier family 22 member 16-like [Bolinopsis microptera]